MRRTARVYWYEDEEMSSVEELEFPAGEIHILTADGGVITLEVLDSRRASEGGAWPSPWPVDPTPMLGLLVDVTGLFEAAFRLNTGRAITRLELFLSDETLRGELAYSDAGVMQVDALRAYYNYGRRA